MRVCRSLMLVLAFLALPSAQAQRSQEYQITLVNGRSFSYVMEEDWKPVVRQGQILLKPSVRILAMDVALIQPVTPNDVRGLRLVKLLPREPRVNGNAVQVWVAFDPFEPGAPLDVPSGLVPVAPQTWIRPGAFRMVLE